MTGYRSIRIAGKITKLICFLFILTICGFLIWRAFFSTEIPKKIDTMISNPRLSEAYQATDGDITLRYQELASVSLAKETYGYFSVASCVFIPEADQVQLVFRYNNSTIRHLQEDYGLPELPNKSEHLFDVSLVKTTDLTPDNDEDDLDGNTLSKERILPSMEPIREETDLYTFYRYVFDGVTLEDVTDAIYVDVYYVNDIRYEDPPYSSLLIYAWDEIWKDYKPSKADINAMKQS